MLSFLSLLFHISACMKLGDRFADHFLPNKMEESTALESGGGDILPTPPASPDLATSSSTSTLGELFRSLATEQRRLADLLFRWAFENAGAAALAEAAAAREESKTKEVGGGAAAAARKEETKEDGEEEEEDEAFNREDGEEEEGMSDGSQSGERRRRRAAAGGGEG